MKTQALDLSYGDQYPRQLPDYVPSGDFLADASGDGAFSAAVRSNTVRTPFIGPPRVRVALGFLGADKNYVDVS